MLLSDRKGEIMKIGKQNLFCAWFGLLFVYLILLYENILGFVITNRRFQLLYMDLIFAIGVFFLLIFSDYKVSRFIFLNLLFVCTEIVSTVFFNEDVIELIPNIIYISFWLVVVLICYHSKMILSSSKFLLNIMILSDFIMMASFYVWCLKGGGYTTAGVNAIYYIICLFPMMFLTDNKIIKYAVAVGSFASVFLAGKRTAFIALIIAFAVPYLCKMLLSNDKNKIKYMLSLIVISVIAVFLYDYLVGKFNLMLFERMQNIGTDKGSGRLDIYKAVFSAFNNSNILHKLLGYGYNGVFNCRIIGTSAHNDFLEILFDYGMIGFLLYLLILGNYIVGGFRLLKSRNNIAYSVISTLCVVLIMSLFSHLLLYPTYVIYLLIILMIGRNELSKKSFKSNIKY